MRWATVERLRMIGWAVFALLLLIGVVVLARSLFRHNTAPMRPQQTITHITLPPPPPPPPPPLPPKDEPQKPPEVQPKEQTPTPQKPSAKAPPSKSAAAPPGNPLTAPAGPGSNAYGLSVGNGGGDTVGGGGGGGDPYGYYDGVLTAHLRSLLSQNDRTRYGAYTLDVSVWVDGSGAIVRVELMSSTGDASRDAAIRQTLLGSVGEAAPDGYPNPRRLRIRASAPG